MLKALFPKLYIRAATTPKYQFSSYLGEFLTELATYTEVENLQKAWKINNGPKLQADLSDGTKKTGSEILTVEFPKLKVTLSVYNNLRTLQDGNVDFCIHDVNAYTGMNHQTKFIFNVKMNLKVLEEGEKTNLIVISAEKESRKAIDSIFKEYVYTGSQP